MLESALSDSESEEYARWLQEKLTEVKYVLTDTQHAPISLDFKVTDNPQPKEEMERVQDLNRRHWPVRHRDDLVPDLPEFDMYFF